MTASRRLMFGLALCLLLTLLLVVPVGKEDHVYSSHTFQASLEPFEENSFVVRLKVGIERVTQYLYLDTGSSLTWIFCRPWELLGKNPKYDSRKSSSYRAEECDKSEFCFEGCDRSNRCIYYSRYGMGVSSKGVLSRETFVFESKDNSDFGRSEVVLEDFLFGCAGSNKLDSDGILGLAHDKKSLLAQTHSVTFSYCLGDVTDVDYEHNRLIIGDPVKERLMYEIPMIVFGKYYIDILAIEIGGIILDVDTTVLRRDVAKDVGGMVVDTTATMTHFPRVIFDKFAKAVSKLIDGRSLKRAHDPNRLCYYGRYRVVLSGFPTVGFSFRNNARMEFQINNLFRQVKGDVFCLAFYPIDKEYGIFGVFLQQGYYISFNVEASTFAFERADCAALEDKKIHDEL